MFSKIGTKKFALTIPILLSYVLLAVSQANGSSVSAPISHPVDGTLAQNVVLTNEQGKYPLGLHLALLEDRAGTLTVEEVASPAISPQFTASTTQVPNFGYTNSVYWARFQLDNKTQGSGEWLLELGYPRMQYADLYIPAADGKGFSIKQSGILRPVSNRDVFYPNIVFKVNLPGGSQQTYYMRFQNGGSMTIPLTLWTNEAFLLSAERKLILDWFFFGCILALLASHLFLLKSIRETSYLYFVILLASLLVMVFDYKGYTGVYIFPNWYNLRIDFFSVSLIIVFLSILLFTDAYLKLKATLPNLHRAYIGMLVLGVIILLLIPIIPYSTFSRIAIPWALGSILAIWVIGVLAWRKGIHPPRLFVFAWMGMTISVFMVLLVREGIVTSNNYTENAYMLGFIFMAVCWSFTLVERINLLKSETETANLDLKKSQSQLAQILEGIPLGVVVYGKDQKPGYINQRTAELIGNPHIKLQQYPNDETPFTQALQSFSFKLAGTDQNYPVERTPIYRALAGDSASADDIELPREDKRISLEIWARPIVDDSGEVNAAVAVFQDITQRKQAEIELLQYRKRLEELVNQRTADLSATNEQLDREIIQRKKLEESLVKRIEWLSAFTEIHQNISGIDDLPEAYKTLSEKILYLLGAKSVFVIRWDGQDKMFEMIYQSVPGSCVPDIEVLKEMFQKGGAIRRVLDVGKAVPLPLDLVKLYSEPVCAYLDLQGAQSMILSPMMVRQSAAGVLGICADKAVENYIPYQADLAERMAYDLVSLVDDAVLFDQQRTVATLEERNRLARELHDSVAQSLYGISLFTDATRLALKSNKPEIAKQHLDDLGQLSQEAISDMRLLIHELRPPVLDKEGLVAALQTRLDSVEARAGFQTDFQIEGDIQLSPEQESELYRIAQEALNNVIKHAHAHQVNVVLNQSDHHFRMIITDDGAGFDLTTAEQNGGQGLRNIRERAERIGAQYSIDSLPGRGTKISIEVKE